MPEEHPTWHTRVLKDVSDEFPKSDKQVHHVSTRINRKNGFVFLFLRIRGVAQRGQSPLPFLHESKASTN